MQLSHSADDFFELLSRHYEKCSLIITTNTPFDQWGKIFYLRRKLEIGYNKALEISLPLPMEESLHLTWVYY
ncbi:MAG: ATP-binding protein [Burkholderiales bacterium]|nr:ATP-binding protein [Burkholderiales bacterium]